MDEFDKLHHVNSKGVLNCLKEVMNVMLKQELRSVVGRSGRRSIGRGSIVNIVSIASVIAHPNTVSYTASKSAAHGITKVAGELNHIPTYVLEYFSTWFGDYLSVLNSRGSWKARCPRQCSLSCICQHTNAGQGTCQESAARGVYYEGNAAATRSRSRGSWQRGIFPCQFRSKLREWTGLGH